MEAKPSQVVDIPVRNLDSDDALGRSSAEVDDRAVQHVRVCCLAVLMPGWRRRYC